MNLVRFSNPMVKRSLTDNLLERFLSDEPVMDFSHNEFPKANVVEGKDKFKIELLTPGFEKENIEIKLQEDILTLKGEAEHTIQDGEKYFSREFGSCNFIRRFKLPESVNYSMITAEMNNGKLIINLPKKEDSIAHGPIEIKIS